MVVDEADRVMEDIQNDWLNQVEGAVYSSGKRPRPGQRNMIFYYETQEVDKACYLFILLVFFCFKLERLGARI